jgi:hypothetical protein
VVLARPVRSLNLFWQMVGRGLRGPKAGGTDRCNIVDVANVTRLFSLQDGYQPEVHQREYSLVGEEELERFFHGQRDGAEMRPRPEAKAPTRLAELLLDPEAFERNLRLRELLRGSHKSQLPTKADALAALTERDASVPLAVERAPEAGDLATFWIVHLDQWARERGDGRIFDLAAEVPPAYSASAYSALMERLEALLGDDVDFDQRPADVPLAEHPKPADSSGRQVLDNPEWEGSWDQRSLMPRSARFRAGLAEMSEEGLIIEPAWQNDRALDVLWPDGERRQLFYLYGSGPWVDVDSADPVLYGNLHGGELRNGEQVVRFRWEQQDGALALIRAILGRTSPHES